MNYQNGEYSEGGAYISSESLVLEFSHFIEFHPVLIKVNEANPSWEKLTSYCEQLDQYPDLMRLLTSLLNASHIDFERALFCSWCSLLVAKHLKIAEAHQQALFFAGLFQDIGKYSNIVGLKSKHKKANKPFVLRPQGMAEEVSHPLVSCTYLEETLPNVDGLAELVLYHHAKDDGTGYPHHINESQLGLDNQILIVANEICDRLDQLGGHDVLEPCLASLKVCSLLYFKKAHLAWITILEPHLERPEEFSEIDRACTILELKRERLEKLLVKLLSVSGELLHYDFDVQVHGLRSLIQKLASIIVDTGLLDKAILKDPESISMLELNDLNALFKGLPDIFGRCVLLMDEIIARKFDTNSTVLLETKQLLHQHIQEQKGSVRSIFR